MAQKGNVLNSLFYIIMSIMALNFLAIVIYTAVMVQSGKIDRDDLYGVLQVMIGNRRTITKQQVAEYNRLKGEYEDRQRALEEAEGSPKTRSMSAMRLKEIQSAYEEKIRALKELRLQHESTLKNLRNDIEVAKKDYKKEREKLREWKTQQTRNMLSGRFEKMKKILLASDPELLAKFFIGNMKEGKGPQENARIIRQYLTPEITAEVLGNIPDKDMRQILPLVENKYADMSSEKIAKEWTNPNSTEYKTPEQMALYMRKMTVSQAFRIFTLLDPKIRAELVRYLKKP